jgi:hypothetical protein
VKVKKKLKILMKIKFGLLKKFWQEMLKKLKKNKKEKKET